MFQKRTSQFLTQSSNSIPDLLTSQIYSETLLKIKKLENHKSLGCIFGSIDRKHSSHLAALLLAVK